MLATAAAAGVMVVVVAVGEGPSRLRFLLDVGAAVGECGGAEEGVDAEVEEVDVEVEGTETSFPSFPSFPFPFPFFPFPFFPLLLFAEITPAATWYPTLSDTAETREIASDEESTSLSISPRRARYLMAENATPNSASGAVNSLSATAYRVVTLSVDLEHSESASRTSAYTSSR